MAPVDLVLSSKLMSMWCLFHLSLRALWVFCFVVVSGESWGGITKGQEKKSKEKADREIWREREAGIYCAVIF